MSWYKQSIKIFFACSILIIAPPIFCCKTACIIIHGTFAAGADWYQPGGDFYEAVAQSHSLYCDEVVPFTWSGKHSHKAREQAAFELSTVLSLYESVYIIAHSHGATVALLACTLLGLQDPYMYEHHVHALYALGAPIDASIEPDMHVITRLYNLFSFGDPIQTVFGLFYRVFSKHPAIWNLSVLIDSEQVSHENMHHPVIGDWIFTIPELVESTLYDKELSGSSKPGILHFETGNVKPSCSRDPYMQERLLVDTQGTQLLMFEIFKTFE